MAEQWIDAATAVSLVIDGPHDLEGMRSLCARAHSGLVQTKARLYIVEQGADKKRQEDILLPAEFWWAKGYEALEQNWASGDFSTWINQRAHHQAFGVTFALSGVLDMLRRDQRALIARRLSVAGDQAWISAREANLMAWRSWDISTPKLILEQARLGLVAGRAVAAQRFKHRQASQPVWEEREWDIPVWFWEAALKMDDIYHKWNLDQFNAELPASAGSGWVALSGVHFLVESLQILRPVTEQKSASVPVEEPAAPEAGPRAKSVGQPARAFWDDMIVAVAGLIIHGQLIPTRQAEVTKAMLDWAAINGHDVSDSAVKPKAKKLFEAYQTVGRNFLTGGS